MELIDHGIAVAVEGVEVFACSRFVEQDGVDVGFEELEQALEHVRAVAEELGFLERNHRA